MNWRFSIYPWLILLGLIVVYYAITVSIKFWIFLPFFIFILIPELWQTIEPQDWDMRYEWAFMPWCLYSIVTGFWLSNIRGMSNVSFCLIYFGIFILVCDFILKIYDCSVLEKWRERRERKQKEKDYKFTMKVNNALGRTTTSRIRMSNIEGELSHIQHVLQVDGKSLDKIIKRVDKLESINKVKKLIGKKIITDHNDLKRETKKEEPVREDWKLEKLYTNYTCFRCKTSQLPFAYRNMKIEVGTGDRWLCKSCLDKMFPRERECEKCKHDYNCSLCEHYRGFVHCKSFIKPLSSWECDHCSNFKPARMLWEESTVLWFNTKCGKCKKKNPVMYLNTNLHSSKDNRNWLCKDCLDEMFTAESRPLTRDDYISSNNGCCNKCGNDKGKIYRIDPRNSSLYIYHPREECWLCEKCFDEKFPEEQECQKCKHGYSCDDCIYKKSDTVCEVKYEMRGRFSCGHCKAFDLKKEQKLVNCRDCHWWNGKETRDYDIEHYTGACFKQPNLVVNINTKRTCGSFKPREKIKKHKYMLPKIVEEEFANWKKAAIEYQEANKKIRYCPYCGQKSKFAYKGAVAYCLNCNKYIGEQ